MTSSSIFFWRCRVTLVNFSCWSKFHVNIMTVSGITTTFVYKGLTWNPQIGNTDVCVWPHIWRLRWVRDTTFDTNVSNKKLLNAAKCQGCSFYPFWVIKGKLTGAAKLPPPSSTLIRVNDWKHQNDVIDVVLVFLILTLNIFQTLV